MLTEGKLVVWFSGMSTLAGLFNAEVFKAII